MERVDLSKKKEEISVEIFEDMMCEIDRILGDTKEYARPFSTECILQRLQLRGAMYAEKLFITDGKLDKEMVNKMENYTAFLQIDKFGIIYGYIIHKSIVKLLKSLHEFKPEMATIEFVVKP